MLSSAIQFTGDERGCVKSCRIGYSHP